MRPPAAGHTNKVMLANKSRFLPAYVIFWHPHEVTRHTAPWITRLKWSTPWLAHRLYKAFLTSQVSRSFMPHVQMYFYLRPPEECGLPTPALTKLTNAQRCCMQSIYTDFHPNRLISVGSILRNWCPYVKHGSHYAYLHGTQSSSKFHKTPTLNFMKI
jgi:hypothetical protein